MFFSAAEEAIALKRLKESEMNPPLHSGSDYFPAGTEEAYIPSLD